MKTIEFRIALMLLFSVFALAVSGQQKEKTSDEVFFIVEQMPEFPGGEDDLRQFIASNVQYPEQAVKEKLTGKVYVSFVIDTAGNVSDATIARAVHPLLDNEALRVVNSLPAWEPGVNSGRKVRVAYTVPIQFELK